MQILWHLRIQIRWNLYKMYCFISVLTNLEKIIKWRCPFKTLALFSKYQEFQTFVVIFQWNDHNMPSKWLTFMRAMKHISHLMDEHSSFVHHRWWGTHTFITMFILSSVSMCPKVADEADSGSKKSIADMAHMSRRVCRINVCIILTLAPLLLSLSHPSLLSRHPLLFHCAT